MRRAVLDVDGKSLVPNSMIGYGSGNSDRDRQTHRNLPVLLASSGGRNLNAGRFVKFESTPMCDLLLSLSATGIERLGDSMRRLEGM